MESTNNRVVVDALGPLTVAVGGRPVALPPSQRRLLSILLLDPDHEVATEDLVDRMWGDEPPMTARTAVQVHISGLRKSVPIVTTPTGYRLDHDAIDLDLDRLERLVTRAEAASEGGDWSAAWEKAAAAEALRRGRALPDVADEPFSLPVVRWVDELLLVAADVEVKAMLALGRNDAVILRLGELIERYPFVDRLRRHLMLALYRAGRHGDALRAFQDYRRSLGEAMGIEPGEDLRTLEVQILFHDPALGTAPLPTTPHNLPEQSASFVGRDDELRAIVAELRSAELVTITGGPGFGKSRLAIEVCRSALGDHPGGAWFASLGGAVDDRTVAATIAAAVSVDDGVEDLDDLAAGLRSRPMVLILDNCEHVIDAVRRFVLAMRAEPSTCRLLVTSRRPLGVAGETVHRIDPLPVKPDGAVALLADRIRAVDRTFTVSPENLGALLEVCQRLDGIPLGIELVARSAPTLGLGDIARLLDRIRADTALDTAFEWSVGLLPEHDREVLGVLAVFESAFTLERAIEVCGSGRAELATAGSISRLVDASLIGLVGRSARYRILQPIRELAWERIEPAVRASVVDRHTASFVASAGAAAAESMTNRRAEIFDEEMADHRRALAECRRTGEWLSLLDLVEGLSGYWYARFLAWEGLAWIRDVPVDVLDPIDRARLHRVAGFLAWAVHAYEEADAHQAALHALGIELGDRVMEADALYGRGLIHQKRRFLDGAAMLEEAATIYRTLDDSELALGQCLLFRGLDDAYTGDVAMGESLLTQATELLERAGHVRQVSKAQRWLAHCAWRRGDEAAARHHAGRAYDLALDAGDDLALAGSLVELATIEIAWGDPTMAADHLVAALAPIPTVHEVDIAQVLLPVARLASRAGDTQVVATMLAHIDDVYERHGWRPLDEIVRTRELRDAVGNQSPIPGSAIEVALSYLTGATSLAQSASPAVGPRASTRRSSDPRVSANAAAEPWIRE